MSETKSNNNHSNVWHKLEKLHEAKAKVKSPLILSFLSSFQTEIIEIAMQIEDDYKLAGYKINPDIKIYRLLFSGIKKMIKSLINNTFPTQSLVKQTSLSELIFIIEYNSHLKHFLPIAKQLNENKINFHVFFLREDIYLAHREKVPNAILLNNYITKKYSTTSNIQLLKINLWITTTNILTSLLTKKQKGFRYKLELLLLINRLFKQTRLQEFALQDFLSDSIKRVVVFFKSEGTKIRSLIPVCKSNGAETLAVQHGYIAVEVKQANLPINKYLVWSDVFCKNLEKSLANCECIPLGSSAFDDHFHQTENRIIKSINSDNINILFLPNSGTSQTPKSEVIFALNQSIDLLNNFSTIRLSVKPHPSDNSNLIKERISKNKKCINYIEKHTPINYQDYDIILTMNSTTGIEAAIFQKPLIILLSSPKMLLVDDYLNYNIGMLAFSNSTLFSAYIDIIQNYEDYQKRCINFTNKYLSNGGRAKEYIANYIKETCYRHCNQQGISYLQNINL